MSDRLPVALDNHAQTTALVYLAATDARMGATLVLAHGAGAPQTSPFMIEFARGLSARGIDVVTFNFLYAEQKRRIPDRAPVLEATYRAVIHAAHDHGPLAGNSIFIGGKSMGGRMATHVAAQAGADAALRIPDPGAPIALSGVILLGYPLHPPGKPEQLRAAHLPDIRVPMLLVQGERDTFGTPAELRPILDTLRADVTLHVVERGDHSLAPSPVDKLRAPRASGGARRADAIAATYAAVQDVIAGWIRDRTQR